MPCAATGVPIPRLLAGGARLLRSNSRSVTEMYAHSVPTEHL